jgi:hypothetical protein
MPTAMCARSSNIRYYRRYTPSVGVVKEIAQNIDDALWVVC